jgi:hypothetical protein
MAQLGVLDVSVKIPANGVLAIVKTHYFQRAKHQELMIGKRALQGFYFVL